MSALHDEPGEPRTNSSYVNQRLAGQPRQGPPTNVPSSFSQPSLGSGQGGYREKEAERRDSGYDDGDVSVMAVGKQPSVGDSDTPGSRSLGEIKTVIFLIILSIRLCTVGMRNKQGTSLATLL